MVLPGTMIGETEFLSKNIVLMRLLCIIGTIITSDRFVMLISCLLYAETLNELNATPPAKAVECVNRVRNRVNLPNIESSEYYDGSQIVSNKEAFREQLKIERGLELAMECVRWIDLKRWGINDETTLSNLKQRDSDFNNFIIGKSIRMPIPQSEVDNNPNLNQNDQY